VLSHRLRGTGFNAALNWSYIGLQRRLTGTFGKIPYGLLCPKITSGEAICKVRPTGETASSDVFTGTILVRLLKLRTSAWTFRGFRSTDSAFSNASLTTTRKRSA